MSRATFLAIIGVLLAIFIIVVVVTITSREGDFANSAGIIESIRKFFGGN